MTPTSIRNALFFKLLTLVLLFMSAVVSGSAEEKIPTLSYAEGFRVEAFADGCRLVTVLPPWEGDNNIYRYFLVPRGQEVPKSHPKAQVVTVPVERFVTLSSSQLPYLDAAGKMDLLVGLGGTEHISTVSARRLVEAGKIRDVGFFTNVRMETLMDLSPDIVMASASGSARESATRATSVPWLWDMKATGPPTSPARMSRLRATASRLSSPFLARLRESYGGGLTPPRRVVKKARTLSPASKTRIGPPAAVTV